MSLLRVLFRDFGDNAWYPDELFDESQVLFELGNLGVVSGPMQRTRSVDIPLVYPLTREQERAIQAFREKGLCVDISVIEEEMRPEQVVEILANQARHGNQSAALALLKVQQGQRG